VGSWLYRVAYRVALRVRLRAAQRAAREEPLGDLLAAGAVPDVVWRDLRPVLDEEINRLPERYRAAFVLCYLQGRTNAEAARELGCPEGTILSRLFWARQRLRGRLKRRGVMLASAALSGVLLQGLASAALPAALAGSTRKLVLAVAAGQGAGLGVTSLAEGVLRAMWLTKVKVAASLLLTVAVVAGGAGLLAYRVWGAEQPGAQTDEQAPAPASQEVPQPPPAAQPRREADQDLLQAAKERLQVEKERQEAEKREHEFELRRMNEHLERLERDFQKQEEKWSDELLEARKQLIVAEEQLRGLERRQAAQRDSAEEGAELRGAEKNVQSLRSALEQVTTKIDRDQIMARLEEARAAQRTIEQRIEKKEQERTAELVEARLKVAVAEERLRRVERRQATQRERAQAQLQALDERIRQLQGGPPRPEAAPARVQELERKVDQLLREVMELRRELRRQPPEKERESPHP
jgi:hypothetical protein